MISSQYFSIEGSFLSICESLWIYFESETVAESYSFTDAYSDSDGHSDYSEKLFKNVNYVKSATQACDSCDLLKIEREGQKKENERLQNLLSESIVWVCLFEEENSNLQYLVYHYQILWKNGQLFKKTTGLEKESFDILFELLDQVRTVAILNIMIMSNRLLKKQPPLSVFS